MSMWVLCLYGPVGGAGVWLKTSRKHHERISEATGKEKQSMEKEKRGKKTH